MTLKTQDISHCLCRPKIETLSSIFDSNFMFFESNFEINIIFTYVFVEIFDRVDFCPDQKVYMTVNLQKKKKVVTNDQAVMKFTVTFFEI